MAGTRCGERPADHDAGLTEVCSDNYSNTAPPILCTKAKSSRLGLRRAGENGLEQNMLSKSASMELESENSPRAMELE